MNYIAVAPALASTTVTALASSTQPITLALLIERHRAAEARYLHWADAREEIEDSGRIPEVQVQYGRRLGPRDSSGNDT